MIMFGISIFLWIVLPQIPLVSGTPVYLQHPLIMLELFSLLSTVIVWIMVTLISLYSLVKQKISIKRSVNQNLFVVCSAFITVIVGISGSVFFSKTIPSQPTILNGLWTDYAVTPDPFGLLYGFGILFCEGTWLAHAIFHVYFEKIP
jgi:hypothetical protein